VIWPSTLQQAATAAVEFIQKIRQLLGANTSVTAIASFIPLLSAAWFTRLKYSSTTKAICIEPG
jgi:hypothetical protein